MTQRVLALGNFDGLHRGHLAVLQTALDCANAQGLTPAVLLFDRHPKEVLTGVCPPLLMTEDEKRRRLRQLGFSLEIVSFEALRDLSPQAFLETVRSSLSPAALCCGNNYRFGKQAAGNVQTLQTLASACGIRVQIAPDVLFDGAPVSSTRIRLLLETGEVCAANAMLGRPFSYAFDVIGGDKRGRTLGFPTANQSFPPQFVQLRRGVYASKVCLKNVWYPAVTNIGVRPTIGTPDLRSETHILGFSGDLYGQTLEVHLLQFLRDETNFGTLEALKQGIAADVQAAKNVFERTDHETNAECQSRLF